MIRRFFKRKEVNIKRVITICDEKYFENCKRLIISLTKTNPEFSITVYHNSNQLFSKLCGKGNVNLVYLDEINKLTVKRAKFFAYWDAIKKGDFLYLDSDIVVLDDIFDLFSNTKFTGCHDPLNDSPYINDKKYPWLGNTSLENKVFINSGVFFAFSR